MKTKISTVILVFLSFCLVSCEKVSPIGVLVSGTGVEDRVHMSSKYYAEHNLEVLVGEAENGEYTFLIGADSHVTNDISRMSQYFQNGIDHDDLFFAHLGDIADTKAEYYIKLDECVRKYRKIYLDKNYKRVAADDIHYNENYDLYYDEDGSVVTESSLVFPFFPVVGNHDLTHNGWSLWSNMFHSSFYEFNIKVGDTGLYDHFIFLDTASGTLGEEQIRLIEEGVLDGDENGEKFRYTFVFGHTNIFRPSSQEFASTFAKEELYYLLDRFKEWNTTAVFCGHVHAWDERDFGGVHYLTLDSMCEANNPNPGDYLVRVHVHVGGNIEYERVRMN